MSDKAFNDALDAMKISPSSGYTNTATREGASAPDAATVNTISTIDDNAGAPTRIVGHWACGHPLTAHTRAEATECFALEAGRKAALTPPPASPRRASDICTEAARLVGGDREVAHGDKSINFSNTAALWNALIECKLRQNGFPASAWEWAQHPLDALDVANFLEAFKIARRYSGSHNLDDYIDGAGYAGCAGEIAEKLNANNPSK